VDRALRLERLREALGEHPRLTRPPPDAATEESAPESEGDCEDTPELPPTPDGWVPVLPTAEELQQLLAQTEVQIFLNQRELPDSLLTTGWYLHGVASADSAADLYSAERQRRAFAISAHIFDLATLSERNLHQQLTCVFAAQVGYHRSEREPNAIAMGKRVTVELDPAADLLYALPTLSLQAGVALLGLNLIALRALTEGWRAQFTQLASDIGVVDLTRTMFGPTYCVVEGTAALARFLATGSRESLATARRLFDTAVRSPEGDGDHDARWVASHLRFLADEMDEGSVWSLLPPALPAGAKQAFTLTRPYVLTLWKPQRDLLKITSAHTGSEAPTDATNALDPAVRRILLSVPTSAGKTLLAQLIIVAHLAASHAGICYVVPQRSLGREVRRDLSRRLRVLARDIGRDEPDFQIPSDGPLAEMLRTLGLDPLDLVDASSLADYAEADVSVMTPERLSHALRDNPDEVLRRYSLFVFDEAHLIGERSRGFLLESTLTFLHWRTKETHHRIILLSAALGNAGQLAQWLRLDEPPILLESNWRGPRRLHAIFNTDIDWNNPAVEAVAARGRLAHLTQRQTYDTYGIVRLRPAENRSAQVRTTSAIGKTCFRATALGVREPSPEARQGTPLYKMLADIIRYVGHAGPVLVIRGTRSDAVAMAQAIASDLPDDPTAQALADFAEIRLGGEHPLPQLLRKRVAYHHAGLPIDLQDAIEEGIRSDVLAYIVATSTLTEGVNLPVRTVVLAAVPYKDQPIEQQLVGARLINAIGRAGRAAKESEGWAILARAAKPSDADFNLLEPPESELEVRSQLISDEALAALAAFEDAVRAGEDALVSAASVLADFVAFTWFVLATQEKVGRAVAAADPIEAFACTLAYAQLPDDVRRRYDALIGSVTAYYEAADPARRRRWAKTGTSVATARVLDDLAQAVADRVLGLEEAQARAVQTQPTAGLKILDDLHVFDSLLGLPERPKAWAFHKTVSSRSPEVVLSPAALLGRWIGGWSLAAIADDLLSEIPDRPLRLERLVDTVTDFCEHYFAWMLGALLALTNEHLAESGRQIAPDLGVFARYGVASPDAVTLLLSGIRSRELSVRIAEAASAAGIAGTAIRSWLSDLTLSDWRSRFDATTADLADLLEFVRPPGSTVLQTLLAKGTITITVQLVPHRDDASVSAPTGANARPGRADASVGLMLMREFGVQAPAPLAVYDAEVMRPPVAVIPTSLHNEVELILETGLPLTLALSEDQLALSLDDWARR
jgi:hypothetical protein